MCGIAGIIGDYKSQNLQKVENMVAILNHRGPDASKTSALNDAVLGFARLSIIDLSERAMQPMVSQDERYIMVFNGEIYNYKELRHQLESQYVFKTESDSETLLAAYVCWGANCLEKLNGMFAFCIYDTQKRQAFLARDRFGQKPLYFSEQQGALIFASEMKALLAAGVKAEPDMDTWRRYLITGSYDDNEATYFSGISQLLPGEAAHFSSEKGMVKYRYYNLEDRIQQRQLNIKQAADETLELMVDVCRLHMRADVPISVMLSGGLDSSSILASLDKSGEKYAGLKCFSVDFGNDLTERPWIEAVASYHNLSSRIDSYTPEKFHAFIKKGIWHLEGPIGGLMGCALDDVYQACKEEQYTVLQDGSGLDECFGGYQNHHNLYLGTLIQQKKKNSEQMIEEYANNWGVDKKAARRAAELELTRTGTTIDGTIPVRPDLLLPAISENQSGIQTARANTGDPVRNALIDYLQIRKIPRNTRMYDRHSMAYGLELRLPFLDHRLIEFALSLPSSHYFLHGRTKGIVREAMKGLMDETARIAVKRSIQAPQGAWLMRKPMKGYIQNILDSDSFASRGLFDVNKAKNAFKQFCAGAYDNSFFVWQWINVEEWFRVFIDNDAVSMRHPLCPSLLRPLHKSTMEPLSI